VRSVSGLSAAARLAAGGERMTSNCGVVVKVKDLGEEAGLRRDDERKVGDPAIKLYLQTKK
jgi:hypothetical protein